MTVVFGLRTRLYVRMHTRLVIGVLHNGQHKGSAVNSFISQGKLEALKTLSGRRALLCGKHQFHVKITVNTWTVFESSLFNKVV